MENDDSVYCYYSDLPSPMAYMAEEEAAKEERKLSVADIDRIIGMAWEDRTPFDAIEYQFGLREDEVKALMKSQMKFSSYKLWRQRVEACSTKHAKTRLPEISRYKCSMQRDISFNKISKRRGR